MVYFLDTAVNLALNMAGFSGIGDPHQILIAVVLGTAAVLWNSSLVPKWALSAFFTIMALASAVAIYALALGRQPTCIYEYDDAKPVFGDSLTRKLAWAEVRNLDCPTLWVARNELYFRSNYCFFTPVSYSYFGNDDKCDPEKEEVSTPVGADNARIISRMEKRKNCPSPLDSCKKLGKVTASKANWGRTMRKVQD
jgi:hypothetical protein